MPVTFQNWAHESARFLKPRSADLSQVDQRVRQFRTTPNLNTLRQLAAAILEWRRSKGAWHTSIRAGEMAELINLVKAESRVRFAQAQGQIFSWLHCEPLINQLAHDPFGFLNNPMRVLVIAGEPDGPATFRMTVDNDDGVFGDGDISVAPVNGPNHRWYTLSAPGRGPGVVMESVLMHRDITPHSTLHDVVGRFHPIAHPVMTTGQLTGCCFIMRRNAGVFECTHIEPNHANWANGNDLQDFLEGLHIPGATYYGRNQYGDSGVSIVGRETGGQWNVYAQRYERGAFHKTWRGVDHILANG